MTQNNESFNQLEHYIDNDLVDVLTEEQRDHIYALAAAAIALDTRRKTAKERADDILAAARMENLPIDGEPATIEYGCKWWICQNKVSAFLLASLFVTFIVAATAFT